jgi:hypothetical protein
MSTFGALVVLICLDLKKKWTMFKQNTGDSSI